MGGRIKRKKPVVCGYEGNRGLHDRRAKSREYPSVYGINREKNNVTWTPASVHSPWNPHSIGAHALSMP